MINTNQIRAKIDGLSAADGADTYWRDRMLEALNEIDELRLRKPSAEEYEEVLAELADTTAEINKVWDTLGLAEYDGEDSASLFIERLQRKDADMHYEIGVMSAITGRRDNETLTEAVTRVCHQLATVNLETAWPPRSVVETLVTAVDHLLEHHDCDTDAHEQFRIASKAAFDWLTSPISRRIVEKVRRLKLEIEDACRHYCGYCKNHSVADAYRDASSESWYHLSRESSTGRWYCAASPIRERRYQESHVFYDPCQTCNPNGSGQCFGHGKTVEEREGVIT